jgi:hypothetical protein
MRRRLDAAYGPIVGSPTGRELVRADAQLTTDTVVGQISADRRRPDAGGVRPDRPAADRRCRCVDPAASAPLPSVRAGRSAGPADRSFPMPRPWRRNSRSRRVTPLLS